MTQNYQIYTDHRFLLPRSGVAYLLGAWKQEKNHWPNISLKKLQKKWGWNFKFWLWGIFETEYKNNIPTANKKVWKKIIFYRPIKKKYEKAIQNIE